MSIASSWRIISRILKKESIETFNSFNKPVSAGDIARLEREFSLKLPSTYVNSMKIYNGIKDHDFLNYMRLLDANEVIESLLAQREVQSLYEFKGYKTTAKSKTRNDKRWRDKWLPIASDDGGDFIIIDLDPGPAGDRGQIVRWKNIDGKNRVLAKSYAQWLNLIANELTERRFLVDAYSDVSLTKQLL